MPLSDRLSAPQAKPRRCAVGRILDSLSIDDGNALVEALVTPSYTTTAIRAALLAEGHSVSRSTVFEHRRGGCGCGPR